MLLSNVILNYGDSVHGCKNSALTMPRDLIYLVVGGYSNNIYYCTPKDNYVSID